MMTRKFFTTTFSVLTMVFLSGCPQAINGGNGSDTSKEFSATLDGAQEVPPIASTGTGSATLTLEGDVLSFDIVASGLSGPVTAAHIHTAPAGQDGGVTLNLADFLSEVNGEVSIEGEWTLSAAELTDLEAGALYINLHTGQFPDGELRGQITEAQAGN